MSPKTPGLENQGGWHPRVSKCIGNWDLPIKGLTCGLTSPKTQQVWKCQDYMRRKFANLHDLAGRPGDDGNISQRQRHYQMPLLCSSPNLLAQVGNLGCGGKQPQHYPATLLKPKSSAAIVLPYSLAEAGRHKQSRYFLIPGLKSKPATHRQGTLMLHYWSLWAYIVRSFSHCLPEAREKALPAILSSFLAKASRHAQSTQGMPLDLLAWWPRGLAFLSSTGL